MIALEPSDKLTHEIWTLRMKDLLSAPESSTQMIVWATGQQLVADGILTEEGLQEYKYLLEVGFARGWVTLVDVGSEA